MFKRSILAASASLALLGAAPLAAQEAEADADAAMAELDGMMEAMGALFPAEPLTPEQKARLPQAQRIIALVIPEGTIADLMGNMFDDMLGPIMAMAGSGAKPALAGKIGVSAYELDMTDEEAADIMALFDPAWAERQEREMAAFPQMMRDMMTLMEPGMRKAMSEAYAVRFTSTDLDGIEAFFATEVGAKYARESFAMASDPRMIGASMEALPAMMGAIGDMEARIKESTADLPAERSFDELSAAERARVVAATGFSEEDIRIMTAPQAWSEDGDMSGAEGAAEEATEAAREAAAAEGT